MPTSPTLPADGLTLADRALVVSDALAQQGWSPQVTGGGNDWTIALPSPTGYARREDAEEQAAILRDLPAVLVLAAATARPTPPPLPADLRERAQRVLDAAERMDPEPWTVSERSAHVVDSTQETYWIEIMAPDSVTAKPVTVVAFPDRDGDHDEDDRIDGLIDQVIRAGRAYLDADGKHRDEEGRTATDDAFDWFVEAHTALAAYESAPQPTTPPPLPADLRERAQRVLDATDAMMPEPIAEALRVYACALYEVDQTFAKPGGHAAEAAAHEAYRGIACAVAEVIAARDKEWSDAGRCFTLEGLRQIREADEQLRQAVAERLGCEQVDNATILAALSAPPDLTAAYAIRPEVAAFAQAMEAQLRANDHKPGWKGNDPCALLERLREETDELAEILAVGRGGVALVEARLAECADVANFAMMIADVCGGLAVNAVPGLRGAAGLTVGQALGGLDPESRSHAVVWSEPSMGGAPIWFRIAPGKTESGEPTMVLSTWSNGRWGYEDEDPIQIHVEELRYPARLVPVADADLDPTTRDNPQGA